MPPPAKASVAAEAWRSIFDFIVATAPQRNRYLSEAGLTPNDSRALSSLDGKGRTMGSLAQEWNCDASTATWIVDRLEAKGLVLRRPHPTDRRAKLVVLTAAGTKVQRKTTERMYVPPAALLELEISDLVRLRDAVRRLPNREAGPPSRNSSRRR
jgi:DNA-binding MarR family transcriptional regulator